jgi:peroxiredoxin Q/BCP
MKTLQAGEPVPLFTLKDQDNNDWNISNHIGKSKLIIYFYPKDESAVCTKEACAFRDSYTAFTDAGIQVIGINSGTVESHKSFQQHHRLPFVLLSDPGNSVLKKFGVKNVLFLTGRETFVIEENGLVSFRHRGFLDGNQHAEEMLNFLSLKK